MNKFEWRGRLSHIKILDGKWGQSALFKLSNEVTKTVSCMLTEEKLICLLKEGEYITPIDYFPAAWAKQDPVSMEWKYGMTMRIKAFKIDEPTYEEQEPVIMKQATTPTKLSVDWDEDEKN